MGNTQCPANAMGPVLATNVGSVQCLVSRGFAFTPEDLMRIGIQLATIVILGAAGLACGASRSGPEGGSAFARYAGIYRFEERVSPDLYLDGRFMVQSDTIELELKTALCRAEPNVSIQALAYSCGNDVWIRFDRLQPIVRVTYTAKVLVTETRTVCVRYVMNKAGQQVCAETKRESYQRVSTRSGRLKPQRLENVEWGSQ